MTINLFKKSVLGKIFTLIIFTSFLVFNSCSAQEHKVFKSKDVSDDTLSTARDLKSPYIVEDRNNQLLMKYIYSGKSEAMAINYVIGLCIGNIERYCHYLPDIPPHKLNEAPIVYGKYWKEIEPLYTKVLSATRVAISDYPKSAILFEQSSILKCRIGDVGGAIQDMLTAITFGPNAWRYMRLGFYYELNNEFAKACENLKKARDLGQPINQSRINEACERQ
jgi:hypothetical protein